MTFSIGDVLEQLSDEFPDITVSKIRFLESQGLIAPMRTASGFRMFSDTDITKLKWILLHQRDRFLPLKVIKEYLASVPDEAFADGNMPSFDFESSGTLLLEGNDNTIIDLTETEDEAKESRDRSHLIAVPDDAHQSEVSVTSIREESNEKVSPAASSARATLLQEAPPRATGSKHSAREAVRAKPAKNPYDSVMSQLDIEDLVGATEAMPTRKIKTSKKTNIDAVVSLEAMTIETGISGPVLKDLVKFGVLDASGTGNALVFARDEITLAHIIAPLLERGIEVRHIKNYVLFASREIGFLEHVVQDDLRKRNPQSLEIAQEKAKQFIQDTARLKEMLLLRALKKESHS